VSTPPLPQASAVKRVEPQADSRPTLVLPIALLLSLGWLAMKNPTTFHMPSTHIWQEAIAAFTLSGALNAALATLVWHSFTSLSLLWSVLLLGLPYLLPLQHGIAASAVALNNFIGVWKALDALAGTRPAAVVEGGFGAFVLHFASPVEYRIEKDSEGRAKPLCARQGLWREELGQTARDYAALALVACVRSALLAPSRVLPAVLLTAGALYSEVWTIYLFLRLFTGAFSIAVATCGFQAQPMWAAPLTASTSVSDFWSRRWNLLIHGLFRRTVFAPLTRRGVAPWVAGALAFGISGAFHEYAFALQQPSLRESLGPCFLFFLAQAPAVSAEKALRRLVGVPPPFARSAALCTVTWTLLLVPNAPLFLHPLKTSGVFEQIYQLVPRLAFEGHVTSGAAGDGTNG